MQSHRLNPEASTEYRWQAMVEKSSKLYFGMDVHKESLGQPPPEFTVGAGLGGRKPGRRGEQRRVEDL
jgi:hypothetical protein